MEQEFIQGDSLNKTEGMKFLRQTKNSYSWAVGQAKEQVQFNAVLFPVFLTPVLAWKINRVYTQNFKRIP